MKHEITEADVIGFFRDATAKYAPQFPEIPELGATYSQFTRKVGFFGWVGGEIGKDVSAYAHTFEEAARQLREKLGTPENVAAKKREQAARLIAEADALEASK